MNDEFLNRICEVLNRAIKLDTKAVQELLSVYVDCNSEIADDSEIQVNNYNKLNGQYQMSAKGLLCGIAGCHTDGFSRIAFSYETVCDMCDKVVDGKYGSLHTKECGGVIKLGKLIEVIKTKGASV